VLILRNLLFSISCVLAVFLAVSLTGCRSEKKFEANYFDLFDTVTTISAYCTSGGQFDELSGYAYGELLKYHQLFDIYNNYDGVNNIKTINDMAGKSPVKVDKEIIDLLLFSKKQHQKTDCKVNIAFGAVLKIWHDFRTKGAQNPQNAQLPPFDLLKSAAGHTDIDKIIINESLSTVYLEDAQMSIDVGAVGKGFAAERAAAALAEKGFNSVLINIGGNIRAVGGGAKGRPWKVGVQNPRGNDILYTLNISDLSVVTSGDYQRKYTVGGRDYHHIINPDTLFPSDYYTFVTVVCGDSAVADALSTALFNMPFEQGFSFAEKLPEADVLWGFANGEVKYTGGFMKRTGE
jgi:thiamine biosynthesis lipoprotein